MDGHGKYTGKMKCANRGLSKNTFVKIFPHSISYSVCQWAMNGISIIVA